MPRFDVHRVETPDMLALNVQADLLDGFNTRLVVPLVTGDQIETQIDGLNPVFSIDGRTFVMLTQHLAAVPTTDLGDVVCSLKGQSKVIEAAIHFLFEGL